MANSVLQGNQNNGGINPNMIKQFQQFRSTFQGDPKQKVMSMLNSGQITNPQLQQAMSAARQLQGLLK